MHLSLPSILALQLALDEDTNATDAFEQWRQCVDLERLPPAQYPLLPLICHRLERLGIDHPWLPRLKGIYRKTWYANQVAQSMAADIVSALAEVGVQPVAVGALALAPSCYPDLAMRPIQPPAIVAPMTAVASSLRTLLALGWQPEPAAPHLLSAEFHAWVPGQYFMNAQRQRLWLGWHVIPSVPCADLDAACLDATAPLSVGSTTLLTLSSTDNLLGACLSAGAATLIDYADAAFLIRTGSVDWPRLVDLAGRFALDAIVADTLDTLATVAAVAIPPAAHDGLHRILAGADDEHSAQVARRVPVSSAARARFERLYARYLRLVACRGTRPSLRSFATFLQHNYRLASPWQIPRVAVGRLLR